MTFKMCDYLVTKGAVALFVTSEDWGHRVGNRQVWFSNHHWDYDKS